MIKWAASTAPIFKEFIMLISISGVKVVPISEVEQLFAAMIESKQVGQYQKVGVVKARPAKVGERIDTVIDGKLETTNKANVGDYVVTGPKGEEYIISWDKFKKRYVKTSNPGEYKAIGTCWAFKLKQPIAFTASWGELMTGQPGDFIASTDSKGSDPYRIEHDIFLKTYRVM